MENNFSIPDEYIKILQLLSEEKSYKEIEKELNITRGQLHLRLRLMREMFKVKTSLGLVVKYLTNGK